MCLILNFRQLHLTIPIIKTINIITILNIIQIISKALMSTHNLTSITLPRINHSIKTIMKDNISIPKVDIKTMIINNVRNHLSQECIREMRITLSFLDKNNRNKFKPNQLYKLSQMIF